ncbi:MAG: hypothetical protein H6R27_1633, partial [Proteobacteria bacterium]|nr:hypothetical protein [Pseudomonadota bacterium]
MPGHPVTPLVQAIRIAILPVVSGVVPAYADDLPTLPTVTVVGKVEQPLSEVAATVSVIDFDQITGTLTRDARDLFRFEPGLSVGNDP